MRRRITSSYFDYYRVRYLPLMKQIVGGAARSAMVQSELLVHADRALMHSLIHFDKTKARQVTLVTYLFHRTRGTIRHVQRTESRQKRLAIAVDTEYLATFAKKPEDMDVPMLMTEIMSCLEKIEQVVVLGMLRDGKTCREMESETGKSRDTVCRIKDRAVWKIRQRFPDAQAMLA